MQILPVSEQSGQNSDPFGFVNGLQTYDDSVRSNAFAEFLNIYSSLSREASSKNSSQTLTDLTSDGSTSRSEDRRSSRSRENSGADTSDRDPVTAALAQAANPADLSPDDVSASLPKRASLHMQETRMTRDDLDAMRTGLKKYGLSDSDLSDIENKVSSKEGLTWGEFVRTLSAKMRKSQKTTNLTTAETQGLQTFFQKLGYSPTESQGLIKDLAAGRTTKIMEAVQGRLSSLSEGVTFNATEVSAFLGAMKRALHGTGSKSATENLQSALTGKLSPELSKALEQISTNGATPQALRQILSQFQSEMAKIKQGQAEQDQSLVKLVGDTLEKASQRENLWKKSDHDAKNKETVLLDSHGVGKQVKDGAEALRTLRENIHAKSEGSWSDGGKQQAAHGKEETDFSGLKDQALKRDLEAKQALPKTDKGGENALKMADQAEAKTQTKQGGDQDSSWKDFFSKLKTDQSASLNSQSGTAKTNAYAIFDVARQVQNPVANTGSENVSLRQMLNQVQNGVLSNLGQGRTQLTLQLKPENLGSLSILLQVKNKEVSAVIRADNAESGKLLSAHLDQLKQALQDQGLKVTKLEVQTGLAGSQGQDSWLGQENHNLAREQQEALNGMKMRWRMMGGGGDGLAQDVLSVDQRAILSEPGLHLIA